MFVDMAWVLRPPQSRHFLVGIAFAPDIYVPGKSDCLQYFVKRD